MKKNTLKKKKYSKRYTKRKNNKKKYTKRRNSKKGGAAAVVPIRRFLTDYKLNYFKRFLQNPPLDAPTVWYESEDNINAFFDLKNRYDPNNKKLKVENAKEIRIACFTNFYRMKIYTIIRKLNDYLGDFADVVISGGDGLNINLIPINRLISPDIDVKVILNTTGYIINDGDGGDGSKANWLNLYRKVVVMTEYFVDWVVSCLNYCEGKPPPPGGDYELYENDSRYRSKYDRKLFEYDLFTPINIPNPGDIFPADEIRDLFYRHDDNRVEKYNFLINEVNKEQPDNYSFFENALNYSSHTDSDLRRRIEKHGYPWSRRTSDMRAGNSETPFTLMNVKLIAIDLRYSFPNFDLDYFISLGGVLDIVIAVPGHIGHNGMEKFQGMQSDTFKGYGLTTDLRLAGSNIVGECYCINLNYYMYEMVKMIMYGLRTKNGKLYKDMSRFKTLLYIGQKFSKELSESALAGAKVGVESRQYPTDLKKLSIKLISDISEKLKKDDEDTHKDFIEIVKNLQQQNLDDLHLGDLMLNPDPNPFDKFNGELYDQNMDVETRGGGNTQWGIYNSNSVGKILDNLNIYDFFIRNQMESGILNTINDDPSSIFAYNFSYDNMEFINESGEISGSLIKLNQHDKIYEGTIPIKEHPNYHPLHDFTDLTDEEIEERKRVLIREGKPPIPYPILSLEENYQNNGILFDKRIDYESLTISDSQPGGSILPLPKYDLLTKPPYTCYSQLDNPNMNVERLEGDKLIKIKKKNPTPDDLYESFNTSRIFQQQFSAKIFADLMLTICKYLEENPFSIRYLAQFRYFPDQLNPDNNEIVIDPYIEKRICAAYIYSSIIKGFKIEKIVKKLFLSLRTKKRKTKEDKIYLKTMKLLRISIIKFNGIIEEMISS